VEKQKGPDHAYDTVMKNLHNGAVILLHAVSEDNALALDRIIKGIREKGYELMPFEL
jgi:peptidoglycan-N-acetylmuramic acid deacetylase